MTIDIQRLRRDMVNAGYGAYYGGGFGGGLMGAFDANSASPQELVEMAERMGFDIRDYAVMDYESDYSHTDPDEWDDDYDEIAMTMTIMILMVMTIISRTRNVH